jgi:hypothetical protein
VPGTPLLLVLEEEGLSILDERQHAAPAGQYYNPTDEPGKENTHAFCWPGTDARPWPAH